jgi:CheY-like chemotaxis protein
MKVETLWIIDDDMVSQFAIKYKIGQSYPNNRVSTFYSVQESLDALRECIDGKLEFPERILLDLGMPVLTGWHFLGELEKISGSIGEFEIYIVSAFSNSTDRQRAKNHSLVKGYFEKPLDNIAVDKIFMSLQNE